MADREKHHKNQTKKNTTATATTTNNNKKQKQNHHPTTATATSSATASSISFKPSSDVKGLKFGGQFIVKSFTVRRSRPHELPLLLNLPLAGEPPHAAASTAAFPSTIAYLPTNFTILAHHAWHTLTLGLGTKKSKVVIFVFDTVAGKSAADLTWPAEIPLGEVNRRLIRRGMEGWELARFKFRKGCVTFYVFAVRRKRERGFQCGEDLRKILHAVDQLKDFLDHTAMLAMPNQRSINYCYSSSSSCNGGHPVAAH